MVDEKKPCPECTLTHFTPEQMTDLANKVRATVKELEAAGDTNYELGFPTGSIGNLFEYFERDTEYAFTPFADGEVKKGPLRNGRITLLGHALMFLPNREEIKDPWFAIIREIIVK